VSASPATVPARRAPAPARRPATPAKKPAARPKPQPAKGRRPARRPVRLVRSAPKRRRRTAPFLVMSSLLIGALVVGIVTLQAMVSQTSFRMQDLQTRAKALQQQYGEQTLAVARLSSLSHLWVGSLVGSPFWPRMATRSKATGHGDADKPGQGPDCDTSQPHLSLLWNLPIRSSNPSRSRDVLAMGISGLRAGGEFRYAMWQAYCAPLLSVARGIWSFHSLGFIVLAYGVTALGLERCCSSSMLVILRAGAGTCLRDRPEPKLKTHGL